MECMVESIVKINTWKKRYKEFNPIHWRLLDHQTVNFTHCSLGAQSCKLGKLLLSSTFVINFCQCFQECDFQNGQIALRMFKNQAWIRKKNVFKISKYIWPSPSTFYNNYRIYYQEILSRNYWMPLLERYCSTYTREANQKAFQKSTLYILSCSVLNNSPQSLLCPFKCSFYWLLFFFYHICFLFILKKNFFCFQGHVINLVYFVLLHFFSLVINFNCTGEA